MTAQAHPDPAFRLLERKHVPAEIAALYDQLHADAAWCPHVKALANVPPLMLGIAVLLKPLMGESAAGLVQGMVATMWLRSTIALY